MKKLRAVVLFAVCFASPAGALGAPKPASEGALTRARALDKEGVKAYGEGRYNDAIRYFQEAYRLGGPPFELWNVAKCQIKLDQPEEAAETLERYLAQPDLPREDRQEATAQLEALRKRPSTLTVSSSPPGARVAVDGVAVDGATPLSTQVAPGPHVVTVEDDASHAKVTRDVEARYGRAIIVDVPLSKDERPPPPPDNPYVEEVDRRFALRGAIAAVVPRFGEIGGEASPGVLVSGLYRVADVGSAAISIGGLFAVNGDSWRNATGSPDVAPGCGATLAGAEDGTALSLFAMGAAGLPLTERLRASALAGLGAAAYFVDNVGGDVFVPTCNPSPGAKPALLFGAQLDYAVTSAFRLTAFPLTWQIQPAFDGTRSTPRDASSVWMRFGFGLGAGVDL